MKNQTLSVSISVFVLISDRPLLSVLKVRGVQALAPLLNGMDTTGGGNAGQLFLNANSLFMEEKTGIGSKTTL